jgi:hypothetical protein
MAGRRFGYAAKGDDEMKIQKSVNTMTKKGMKGFSPMQSRHPVTHPRPKERSSKVGNPAKRIVSK